MRRHSHPRMEPGCQMSTLAKMSSLWQDHIHNKAFIFFFNNVFFFLYRYLYTLSVYFHTCFSPQWQCATKRKKRSCISGVVTHDNTQLARAKHCRQMQRGVPHTWTALRHVSGGANENLFALPLRNPFHIKFFVDLLSFRLASGYNTMLHKGERER